MYDNIKEVIEFPSYATVLINEKLQNGWIILSVSQYRNDDEGESYGSVLLGKA